MGPNYVPICKVLGTTLAVEGHSPLLSFNCALLPAVRTRLSISTEVTLHCIQHLLQPSPKHQSHAIYHKLENSLNLAYFESNRDCSSPHEDSPASCPPSCTIGRGRGHPSLASRLKTTAAEHARRQVAGGEPQWKANCTAPLAEYRHV